MHAWLRRGWSAEAGQGLSEYALLVAGIVVLVVAALALFDSQVRDLFASIGAYINGRI